MDDSRPPPYVPSDEYELNRRHNPGTVSPSANPYYPPRSPGSNDGPAAPSYRGPREGAAGKEHAALLPMENDLGVRVRTAGFDEPLPPKVVAVEVVDPLAPVDRYSFVYAIMLIHGMGVLLPWNILINAGDYFMNYKFAPYNTSGASIPVNEASEANDVNFSYRTTWYANMTVAAQLPNLLLNALNLFVNFGGSLAKRIVVSIGILIIVMAVTLGLAVADSTTWSTQFYGITIACVVILNMVGGIYQNSLFGVAASLPSRYINAVIIGNNVCGTFVSLLNIISITLFEHSKQNQAVCYFLIALLFLMVTFATYFLLPRLKFYRYHSTRRQDKASEVTTPADTKKNMLDHLKKLWMVFREIWVHCWNVFFVFFVTLAVFPSVMQSVRPYGSGGMNLVGEKEVYWHPVATYFIFNLFAFLGNLIPIGFTKPGPKWVWIPVLARVLFIPFFMHCNYQPFGWQRTAKVLFESDWAYIFGNVLLALTSGYFSSLCMMYAPGQAKDPRNAPVAGQLAAFFLVLGIFMGLLFVRVAQPLVGHPLGA